MSAPLGFSRLSVKTLCKPWNACLLSARPGVLVPPCRGFGQPAAQTHPHLVQQGEVTPGITRAEYSHRRYQLMDKIACTTFGARHKNHLVIIPAAQKAYMSHDIPYPFRQNTDFLYLCGFQEPDSLLLLQCSEDLQDHKSTLFVPKRDPAKELWEGKRSGVEGALELTAVDQTYNTDQLEPYLSSYLKDHRNFTLWYDYRQPPHVELHRRHLADFMKENKTASWESPHSLVQSLRVIKSPAEIALVQASCQIASQGFTEVMQFSHSGVNEAHLFAKMDFECRMRGAEYLAYPPVVAGGNRANTLHYVSNNQLIHQGELVLMDAGCEYHGYTSDISRTWPVSGKFSVPQRMLYEAVLEVQLACIEMCTSDTSLEHIYVQMLSLIGKQLQRLGLVSHEQTDVSRLARQFCPHHVGHYLGMDVHDTDQVSRSVKLTPGMVVTIEPGLYIPEMRDVPAEFRGQGIRIEDDILITENQPHILSSGCPKTCEEIEHLVATN